MTTLTSEQLDSISMRLDERHKTLREEIRQELLRADEERYIDLAGDVHDAGEESVADMLADLNIAMIDRQIGEIRQIEAAQMRIATGNYGICVDCEEEIDIARLRHMLSGASVASHAMKRPLLTRTLPGFDLPAIKRSKIWFLRRLIVATYAGHDFGLGLFQYINDLLFSRLRFVGQ